MPADLPCLRSCNWERAERQSSRDRAAGGARILHARRLPRHHAQAEAANRAAGRALAVARLRRRASSSGFCRFSRADCRLTSSKHEIHPLQAPRGWGHVRRGQCHSAAQRAQWHGWRRGADRSKRRPQSRAVGRWQRATICWLLTPTAHLLPISRPSPADNPRSAQR